MKKILLFTLILSTTMSFAQKLPKIKGSKNVVLSERKFDSVTALTVYGRIKLKLIKSDTCKLVINADGNLHETVLSTMDKGLLSLELTSRIISKKRFELSFYVDTLSTITLMERSKIEATGTFETDTLRIELNDMSQLLDYNVKSNNAIINTYDNAKLEATLASKNILLKTIGSSRVNLTIDGDAIICKSEEHSKVKFKGKSKIATFKTSESSQIDGKNCIIDNAKISSSDTSEISILTKESLSIQASEKSEILSYGIGKITLEKFTDNAVLRKKE